MMTTMNSDDSEQGDAFVRSSHLKFGNVIFERALLIVPVLPFRANDPTFANAEGTYITGAGDEMSEEERSQWDASYLASLPWEE